MSEASLPFNEKYSPSIAKISSGEIRKQEWEKSIKNPREFWAEKAKAIDWFKPFSEVLDDSNPPFFKWFPDGELNISYNTLDRHVKSSRKNKIAYIWEGEMGEIKTYTYYQLYKEVNKLAKVLKDNGIKKGDRVAIFLPVIPELPISLLATARIGGVHAVIFSGFSAEALADRVNDCGAKILITADGSFRRGKPVAIKDNADRALPNMPGIEKVIVVKRTGQQIQMKEGRDVWYGEALSSAGENVYVEPEKMKSTDPLFILYTSGTTGKPKGVQHGTGGYLVWAYWTLKWAFNPNDEDIYWCVADIGWITGHTYNVYAPLSHGLTAFLFEGTPDYPAQDRWWDMIERHGVTILYGTPTAVRMFMKFGEDWVNKHDLSSLRLLGSVGEPINPEAWKWYYRVIGKEKLPIIDTWWQTETGGFMISPTAGIELTPLKPGSATMPMPGVNVDIFDERGQPLGAGNKGVLVIKSPWPGMLMTLWKDPDRFKTAYFGRWPGIYVSGDYAIRDPDGYFWLLGRADEVLKVAGHRIGTVELESALVSHPAVSEAAVMGKEDAVKGEVPVAFVVLRGGFTPSDELRVELIKHVRTTIGPIATPEAVVMVNKLPKTRSGKIMRRLLKAVLTGAPLGDTSTIEDEGSIDDIKATYNELRKQLTK
ncbi:MAG: acetate--CoA ligase [Candidatus Bathyarchaeota archaeon]|jgi:acetyl-CoA synthetase|nr:acetate--CoA ligase [Candidatus Bathyarchaeota archaeon]MDD4326298.1 acetate--CoA ligase [Candidatus Bathyarchaeota archaeon]MDI9577187.1 acetate--CoA ligase [Thermoproteota archaeon]MDT8782020.1 acetate--CoA ligase [Candidatus Bathyarchaeota archaeon]NLD66610.1 acetate--CoA ligase [Thermoproteota archaeon]